MKDKKKRVTRHRISTLEEALKALEGQVVTVVNPHSFMQTLTGLKIDTEAYPAKIISFTGDTLKILTEFVRNPQKQEKEKVYQFIKTHQIKRIGVSKAERYLFL